uniref:V3 protein n=2 Tax=Tomato leaf curl New Delhi virus TaxID=223347 RepID=G0KYT1_9GEMI|nr:movement protein [Tomato leaf curl New Delhi Virus [India:New Delhi:2012]]CBA13464.1 V3 protein [Tomato leaf curl New Delhi virus [Pakistan:Solanum:2009]]
MKFTLHGLFSAWGSINRLAHQVWIHKHVGSIIARISRKRSWSKVHASCKISPRDRKELFTRHSRLRSYSRSHSCSPSKELWRSDQQISSFQRPHRRYADVSTSTAPMELVQLSPLHASPKQRPGPTGR